MLHNTLLHLASQKGNKEIVKRLISHPDIDINCHEMIRMQ